MDIKNEKTPVNGSVKSSQFLWPGIVFTLLVVIGLSAFAVWKGQDQPASPLSLSQDLASNDRDAHGCIGSAGYQWCEVMQKCIRQWEEKCEAAAQPADAVIKDWIPYMVSLKAFDLNFSFDLKYPTDWEISGADTSSLAYWLRPKSLSQISRSSGPLDWPGIIITVYDLETAKKYNADTPQTLDALAAQTREEMIGLRTDDEYYKLLRSKFEADERLTVDNEPAALLKIEKPVPPVNMAAWEAELQERTVFFHDGLVYTVQLRFPADTKDLPAMEEIYRNVLATIKFKGRI